MLIKVEKPLQSLKICVLVKPVLCPPFPPPLFFLLTVFGPCRSLPFTPLPSDLSLATRVNASWGPEVSVFKFIAQCLKEWRTTSSTDAQAFVGRMLWLSPLAASCCVAALPRSSGSEEQSRSDLQVRKNLTVLGVHFGFSHLSYLPSCPPCVLLFLFLFF